LRRDRKTARDGAEVTETGRVGQAYGIKTLLLTRLPSNLKRDHLRHCGAIWRLPMKIAARS